MLDDVIVANAKTRVQKSKRLPIIFRLMLQGYSSSEILGEVGGSLEDVLGEMAAIEALQREWLDLEKVRTGIAFELDELRWRLLDEIDSEAMAAKAGTRLEYYKQVTQVERQKAELYGLNGPTININNQGRLIDLVTDLKKLGQPEIIDVTTEPATEAGSLESDGLLAVPASTAAS